MSDQKQNFLTSKKVRALIAAVWAFLFTLSLVFLLTPSGEGTIATQQAELNAEADSLRFDNTSMELEIKVNEELVDVHQAQWELLEHQKKGDEAGFR